MLLRAIDDASRVWSSVGLRIALVKSRLLSCLSLHNARGAGTCAQCHLVFSFPEWETRLPSPEQSRVGLAFSLRQPALCSNFEHSRELALKFLLSGGTRELCQAQSTTLRTIVKLNWRGSVRLFRAANQITARTRL